MAQRYLMGLQQPTDMDLPRTIQDTDPQPHNTALVSDTPAPVNTLHPRTDLPLNMVQLPPHTLANPPTPPPPTLPPHIALPRDMELLPSMALALALPHVLSSLHLHLAPVANIHSPHWNMGQPLLLATQWVIMAIQPSHPPPITPEQIQAARLVSQSSHYHLSFPFICTDLPEEVALLLSVPANLHCNHCRYMPQTCSHLSILCIHKPSRFSPNSSHRRDCAVFLAWDITTLPFSYCCF